MVFNSRVVPVFMLLRLSIFSGASIKRTKPKSILIDVYIVGMRTKF